MTPESLSHVPSYWLDTAGDLARVSSLPGDRTVDVAIIGGGYTGLSAAYHLAKTHGVEATVLEANRIGWGASGRNGGFASVFVGKVPLKERIDRWGIEAARRSVRLGAEAVEGVRALIAAEDIRCDAQPPGYVYLAHRPELVAGLQARERLYRETLLYDRVKFLDRSALEQGGYLSGPSAHGALHLKDPFGLHPMKYVTGLAEAAMRRGAAVYEQSPVVGWSRGEDGYHHLSTPHGTVRARRVIVGTDGHTPESEGRLHRFFYGRIMAATSNILVTPPLTNEVWDEVGMRTTQLYCDTAHLLFYWRRLPDNRMLFGGRAGIFDTPGAREKRRIWLEEKMAEKFPALTGVGSDFFWDGKVGLSYDQNPHVGTADGDPTVIYAMAYMGSGVAMATHCGALTADLAVGREVPQDTPVTGKGLRRFPFPFLRDLYLAGAYAVYDLKDRFS